MTSGEFSRISQPHCKMTAQRNRQRIAIRGQKSFSIPQKKMPCKICVKLYGSNKCWELCGPHASNENGVTCPHAHHHRRPSNRKAIAVIAKATTVATPTHHRDRDSDIEFTREPYEIKSQCNRDARCHMAKAQCLDRAPFHGRAFPITPIRARVDGIDENFDAAGCSKIQSRLTSMDRTFRR